jgi:hypothetical protein
MTEPEGEHAAPIGHPNLTDPADQVVGSVGRKLWLVVLVLGLAGAAKYGWEAYGRYRSSLAGFEVIPPAGPASPPQGWQVERAQGYEAACPPDWDVDANFTGPYQWKCVAKFADLGQYPPNCNVIVEPKTDDVVFSSSQEYWSAIRDDMQRSLPSFHLGREETAWFQGVEGIRAEFTHSSAGPETRAFGYYLVGVHNAAVITCSAPPDLAGPYEQTLEGLAGHIYIEGFEPEPERANPSK